MHFLSAWTRGWSPTLPPALPVGFVTCLVEGLLWIQAIELFLIYFMILFFQHFSPGMDPRGQSGLELGIFGNVAWWRTWPVWAPEPTVPPWQAQELGAAHQTEWVCLSCWRTHSPPPGGPLAVWPCSPVWIKTGLLSMSPWEGALGCQPLLILRSPAGCS